MNIKILKWYIIALLIIVLNFTLVPVTKYNSSNGFTGFLVALSAAFFLFLGIFEIKSMGDLFFTNRYGKKDKILIRIAIPILFLVLGTFIIEDYFSNQLDQKFKKEGVIVKATIDSGFVEFTKKREISYNENTLALTMTTKNNVSYRLIAHHVSNEAYLKAGIGDTIDVLYLPENPKIFRLLIDDKTIRNFKNIPNRDLNFKDLENYITLNEAGKLEKQLNSLSLGWKSHSNDKESFGFYNDLKKESIYIHPNIKSLLYICDIDAEYSFEIPQDRIINETKSDSIISYELDKYFIIKKIKKDFNPKYGRMRSLERILMRKK